MTFIVTIFTLAIVVWYFKKRGGYIQYPFLMAVIVAVWLLPQMWYVALQDASYENSLFSFAFFVLTCLSGTLVGYQLGKGQNAQAAISASRQIKTESVLVRYWPLIALTLLGYIVQLAIFSLPSGQLLQRMPTGPLAILKFLGLLKNVSLALSALLYFRFRSRLFLFLLVANVALFLPSLVLEFKRTQFLTLGFVLAAAYWLSSRKEVSKVLMVSLAPVLLLVALGVSELRTLSGISIDNENRLTLDLPTVSEVLSINWSEVVFEAERNQDLNAIELRNALVYREIIDGQQLFTLGAQFWNRLVQTYIPGSLVGGATKEALKIGTDLYDFDFLNDESYTRLQGSTLTGFLQAYSDFWFMGAIVYVVSGFIMGRLYRRACSGMVLQQVVYLGIAVISLSIFTHDSYRLIVYLPWIYSVSYILVRLSFRRVQIVNA